MLVLRQLHGVVQVLYHFLGGPLLALVANLGKAVLKANSPLVQMPLLVHAGLHLLNALLLDFLSRSGHKQKELHAVVAEHAGTGNKVAQPVGDDEQHGIAAIVPVDMVDLGKMAKSDHYYLEVLFPESAMVHLVHEAAPVRDAG